VNVEELMDLSGNFSLLFPVSSGWYSVFVWETNFRLQETKSILFSVACEGLENHILC
jgi:hypothetical protein